MVSNIPPMYTYLCIDWLKYQPCEYKERKFLSRILLSLDAQVPTSF